MCGSAYDTTIGPVQVIRISNASPLLLRIPPRRTGLDRACLLILLAASASAFEKASAQSQASGRIEGLVTRRDSGLPLAGVAVRVAGTGVGSSTGADGRYSLALVPAGSRTLEFRWIGYAPESRTITIRSGATEKADVALSPVALQLADMIVEAASKVPERIVEAPAAISVIPSYQAASLAATNQAPAVLRNVPGFDVVQNGMHDFNINARGFNSSLNRRVLVLQDGRDLSYVLVGAQEWGALAVSLDETGKVEVVRGPGSALYGANAFNGVVNISTPAARDVLGTKLNVSAGELSTLRTDVRHARSFSDGRFAYKLTAGYGSSDTFSRSRTRFDSTDIAREYELATDSAVRKARAETLALKGQTIDPSTGAATGQRDAVRTMYGVGRLDYYAPRGAIGSAEVGWSQVENDIFVTTVGRVQILRSQRPYARLNWGSDNYHLMGYYSGRRTPLSQVSLSSGAPLLERSGAYHAEGQFNRRFRAARGRVIFGASARAQQLDTKETLLEAGKDTRVDNVYSAFGQLEYNLSPKWKSVLGSRVDDGNLYKAHISPKVAIVFSPSRTQSLRATVNQAFQPPTAPELFLRVPAGAPTAGPRGFETGLEAYFAAVRNALTAAGAGAQVAALNLPVDLPFQFAPLTPPLALGNSRLSAQKVIGYEVGYRGEITRRGFVTADLYMNQKRDFISALTPGANSDYPQLFTADGLNLVKNLDDITALVNGSSLPAATKAALLASQPALRAAYQALVNLATTLPDGSRALVLSYANAGKVEERGIELATGLQLTDYLRVDATYTRFTFKIKEASIPGDRLVPNTPRHKGSVSVAYVGKGRIDLGATARFASGYPWLAGVFDGFVPPGQIVTANAGYQIRSKLRAQVVATNLFNQKRFELYGGSVNTRRVVAGLTATF